MNLWGQIWSTDQQEELGYEDYDHVVRFRLLVSFLLGALAVGIFYPGRVYDTESHLEMMFGFALFISGLFAVATSVGLTIGEWLADRRYRKALELQNRAEA